MKRYLIYKLTAPSGLIYLGFTSRTSIQRFKEHVWEARRGSSLPLHKAIRKYGETSFKIEIIGRYSTMKEGLAAEIAMIAATGANLRGIGYNVTPGGDLPPSFAGRKMTAVHKLRCSEARKKWHRNRKSDEYFSRMVATRQASGSYCAERNASTIKIEYQGVIYESIAKLCRSLHIGRAKVFDMMRSGQIRAIGKIPNHYSKKYGFLGINGAPPGHFTKDLANRGVDGRGLP